LGENMGLFSKKKLSTSKSLHMVIEPPDPRVLKMLLPIVMHGLDDPLVKNSFMGIVGDAMDRVPLLAQTSAAEEIASVAMTRLPDEDLNTATRSALQTAAAAGLALGALERESESFELGKTMLPYVVAKFTLGAQVIQKIQEGSPFSGASTRLDWCVDCGQFSEIGDHSVTSFEDYLERARLLF